MIARALAVAIVACFVTPIAASADSAQFPLLKYAPRTEQTIVCSATLICDITLEAGERVHDGFAGVPDEWDPHATYSGAKTAPTPHLIFHPSRAGLHTNAVIPTSRRTYYLALSSDDSTRARYYTFAFPKVFIARVAQNDSANRGSQNRAPAAPIDDLALCLKDVTYTYEFDRNVAPDRAPGVVPNRSPLSGQWQPRYVCTDGRHTFVDFAPSAIVPSDYPVIQVLGPEGDTQLNYTYDARKRRFTIDAVPDAFVLLFGSQASPIRLVVTRDVAEGTVYDPGAKK